MALKPAGQEWRIREQILEDPASGLTFQFSVNDQDAEAPFRLKIFGSGLPFGNREICFGPDGREVGAGTLLADACPPSWIKEVD